MNTPSSQVDPPAPIDFAELLTDIEIPQHSRHGSYEVLLDLIRDVPAGRTLDAPCGPGLLSEALRRLGHEVTAGDLWADGFAPRDIPFSMMDLDSPFPFDDGAFDLVICGDGIEHLENPFALFREFSRVLADGGTLVVATPNYLNLERRLKFLWSGSITKSLARRSGFAPQEKAERGHVNPLTLIRMAYIAETVGLDLVRSATALSKPRQKFLFPLALAIRCFRPFLNESYQRNLFTEHTLTMDSLLGGKVLLAVFRKAAALQPKVLPAVSLELHDSGRRLENLASSLESEHPGAAGSIREGLEQTLTLQQLRIGGSLYRTLRSTNTIENLNGSIGTYTRNVKRWQGGSMILRWASAAVLDASKRFRRIRGYRDLDRLTRALESIEQEHRAATDQQVA